MEHEHAPAEKNLLFDEPRMKRFIKTRVVVPEDFGIIEELSKFDTNLFIATLHNMFAYEGRRSRQTLKTMAETGSDENQKKLCALALQFFKKYGWAASANMVSVLEDEK